MGLQRIGYDLVTEQQWSLLCYICCSVTKLYLNSHNPMDCSTIDFPVPHHPLEFTQVHVQWISDAIQPSHPLLPFSPSAFNLSQHQDLLQCVSWLHQVASVGASALVSVLPMNIQEWFPLGLTGCISLQSKGLSTVFYNTTVQKHQFFSTQLSL